MCVSLFAAMNCSTVIVLFSCLHFGDVFLLFMNSICVLISVISSSTLIMASHYTTRLTSVTIVSMRSMYSLIEDFSFDCLFSYCLPDVVLQGFTCCVCALGCEC